VHKKAKEIDKIKEIKSKTMSERPVLKEVGQIDDEGNILADQDKCKCKHTDSWWSSAKDAEVPQEDSGSRVTTSEGGSDVYNVLVAQQNEFDEMKRKAEEKE